MTFPDPDKIPEGGEEGGYVNRKPKTIFNVGERFAILSSLAQLGVRPPPQAITRVLQNSVPFIKFMTVEDLSNLVETLHGLRWE